MKKILHAFTCIGLLLCMENPSTAQQQNLSPGSKPNFSSSSGIVFKKAIFSLSASIAAFERQVSGRVTDETGEAIPDVSVSLRGSSIGTTTNASGNYTLMIPDERINENLVFSSVGFEEKVV